MKFGIFHRTLKLDKGTVTVSFCSMQNPADRDKHVVIEAESEESAAKQAAELLKLLSIETYSINGDPDTIMAHFPDYFVGKFAVDVADHYDTKLLMYQIKSFTPVPRE